jgi:folate-binding protein YgfZ
MDEGPLEQDNSSGYAALRSGAAIVDVPAGRLVMRGADRRSYLQGIVTNDVAALVPGTGCYAAMLTAQGRMITDMRLLELGEEIVIDVPSHLTQGIKDHLERFVFSEDVLVEDGSARPSIGLYGPRAIDVLQAAPVEGGAPSALHGVTRVRVAGHDGWLVSSDTIGIRGFDLFAAPSSVSAARAALSAAGAVAATAEDVEAVRIESGRPRFGADMDTDTIPLEAGIEERSISRSKGCYVGQEVIVRVQDRGHGRVARRLVGLAFDAGAPVPSYGDVIRSGDREIGKVTSAVWSPSLARPIALGYVQRDFTEPGTPVRAGSHADGRVVTLPFVP